jgi:hypothetical protein
LLLPSFRPFTHHLFSPNSVVLRIFCDDNVDVRVHRRAGPRVRLHLVRERACLCLSGTWPSTPPDATIFANVACASPPTSLATSPCTDLPVHDHGAAATAGIEGGQHVRKARSAWIAGRWGIMDLRRGGTHHNATTFA